MKFLPFFICIDRILAMLTHFSVFPGSFALCGARPRALPYGTRKL